MCSYSLHSLEMTDVKLKCPTRNPSFVGLNVQRLANSFREACCTGLPPSGKIRENFDLLESQGISIFLVESQGYLSDLCREVRESQGKVRPKSQGKSGNSNRADWWQPWLYPVYSSVSIEVEVMVTFLNI